MLKMLFRCSVALSLILPTITNAAVSCKPVSGLSQIFLEDSSAKRAVDHKAYNKNPRFLIIGETHGTVDAPEFFGDIVCNLGSQRPTVVILEFADDQTDILQAYVNSGGTALDKKALLDSYIWDLDYADGRSSHAMFELVEYLRILRLSGARIQVYGAAPSNSLADQHYYELAMANRWSNIAAKNPDAKVLILVGRFHAQLKPDDGDKLMPAASFLLPHDVISFSPSSEGGEAWFAQGNEAKVRNLPSGKKLQRGLYVDANADKNYDGYFAIGKTYSPSRPKLKI